MINLKSSKSLDSSKVLFARGLYEIKAVSLRHYKYCDDILLSNRLKLRKILNPIKILKAMKGEAHGFIKHGVIATGTRM